MEPKETVLKTLKDSNKPLKGGEIAEISGLENKNLLIVCIFLRNVLYL